MLGSGMTLEDYEGTLDLLTQMLVAMESGSANECVRIWRVVEIMVAQPIMIPPSLPREAIRAAVEEVAILFRDVDYMPVLLHKGKAEPVRRLVAAWTKARETLTLNAERQPVSRMSVVQLIEALRRFPDSILGLRRPVGKPGKGPRVPVAFDDEYDVQDVLFVYLQMSFARAKREDPTPKSSGAFSRIDFTVPELNAAIEAKFVRADRPVAELKQQLLTDIEDAGNRPDIDTLVLFIVEGQTAAGVGAPLQELEGQRGRLGVRVVRVQL